MSSIFESFLSTAEALEAFGERAFVAQMLRFESALATAQAECGLIPAAAAKVISACCNDTAGFDAAAIAHESGRAGSVAIPLVKALKQRVGERDASAVAFAHFGSTSQDVIDTASALASRPVLDAVLADLGISIEALLSLADRHGDAPMLARTLGQPGSVTSFGWKAAQWAAPLVHARAKLRASMRDALAVQLGGAVGTQAQMKGKGPEVVAAMARLLGLSAPAGPWHTQRDRWVGLACELALLTGSLGKIAKDLSLLSQWEVGEASEPSEEGRGGSSAMPHKRNPVAAMVALAAAQAAPQHLAVMLAAMPQEHERALGAWQAELAAWPRLLQAAHGSVRAMAQALPGLQVNTQRMRANLDRLRAELPAQAASEWFDPALADHAACLARAQVEALRQQMKDDI
ncbi:lyase family protein [Caenimonas aquaedulcis]|uniref:3-carboxy-cis,cis-muconate cycloisomerase n=1 Tax=Caenimonas aquaedulcis TaxID=2793270 RepID=A0A931ME35_9BURK|nr:lyase family protein [Caenimonas aquaedulcis]MBG9386463.1 3-carboxy-cis,cis-muconate cycloisomerase [Caenimonas aquaedulcis]